MRVWQALDSYLRQKWFPYKMNIAARRISWPMTLCLGGLSRVLVDSQRHRLCSGNKDRSCGCAKNQPKPPRVALLKQSQTARVMWPVTLDMWRKVARAQLVGPTYHPHLWIQKTQRRRRSLEAGTGQKTLCCKQCGTWRQPILCCSSSCFK